MFMPNLIYNIAFTHDTLQDEIKEEKEDEYADVIEESFLAYAYVVRFVSLQLSQLEVRTLIQFLMSSSRGTFFDVGNKCQNPISLQLTGRLCFVG